MIRPTRIRKKRMLIVLFFLFIVITSIVSMGLGYSSLSYSRLIPTFLGEGTFKEEFVLFSIRLPRIVITILAGMALALAGAILQAITSNELADPGIIGINSGAGMAITLFYLFLPIELDHSFIYMLPVVGFIGALLTVFFIYFFSFNKTVGLQPVKLVITGVGVSMALSGFMVVLMSGSEWRKVDFVAKWLSGSIWGSDWPFVIAMLPWLLILIPFSLFKANRLNLLNLSEPVAIGVGVNLKRERFVLLMTSVALAATAVSVTGGIAFIGLMAPHIAKVLIGPRHQLYLPIAILLGGWFLLLADTIGRNLVEPDGIAAGIVTALIGAPYFIYLLLKK
ncbi:iron ABC transporter permease [Hazenella sp. IB182353]|uniref:FecCD family ABC transporter permease n=1 Tax=Polycladospora coralii TaxID=2771432 RepID=UPI0017465BB3|nr:iron ABC transporter permease [Polycladospora coralii]MBS7531901.1 iron ABC transporter permease [Polycladospora coralii]